MPLSAPPTPLRRRPSASSPGVPAYRRCRCCLQPSPASELFPYSFLQPCAFPSLFHHQHAICYSCSQFLHSPGWDAKPPPRHLLLPSHEAASSALEEGADSAHASDDEHESFCRLCGQGHESIDGFMCDAPGCRFIFCPTCIRANGGEPLLRLVETEVEWVCFNHPTSRSRLLPDVDLECRAERGQFWHLNAFDCFNSLQLRPIPSFTYLTPRGKRRFSHPSPSPSPSPHPSPCRSPPLRLLSTCLYKHTSSHPSAHVKYLHGLLLNLQRFPIDWPHWTLRLYYDNSLILPAPLPHEDRDHDSLPSTTPLPPPASSSSSSYTADLCLAWSRLLHALQGCPWFQPVYYNWPYLQDASHHHHGHVGMMARFLALADLGVTATHVAVVDLDNVWTRRGREQAERFERGKLYHRYVDVDYSFPLMGGGFNARVDGVDPEDVGASPFADVESRMHAFLVEHHRQPEAVREVHARSIDESWGGTRYIRQMEREKERRMEQRTREQQRPLSKRIRTAQLKQQTQPVEEAESDEGDAEEADGPDADAVGLVKVGGRLCSRRVAASLARQKREKKAQRERERRAAAEVEKEEEEEATDAPSLLPPLDEPPPPFFTYALDQVFLLEHLYPRMTASLATTYIRLTHIDPALRAAHRFEEASATPLSPPHILQRRLLHQRSGVVVGRFSDYFGMIEQADFPRPAEVLPWMMKRIERVREGWKAGRKGEGRGRRGGRGGEEGEWRRVGVERLCERASPGHFREANEGEVRVRQEWEGLVGPPSATSPLDFRERWAAQREVEAKPPRPLQRALSYSSAHPTLSKPASGHGKRKAAPPLPDTAATGHSMAPRSPSP